MARQASRPCRHSPSDISLPAHRPPHNRCLRFTLSPCSQAGVPHANSRFERLTSFTKATRSLFFYYRHQQRLCNRSCLPDGPRKEPTESLGQGGIPYPATNSPLGLGMLRASFWRLFLHHFCTKIIGDIELSITKSSGRVYPACAAVASIKCDAYIGLPVRRFRQARCDQEIDTQESIRANLRVCLPEVRQEL